MPRHAAGTDRAAELYIGTVVAEPICSTLQSSLTIFESGVFLQMDVEPSAGATGLSGAQVVPEQTASVTVGGFRTAVVTRQQLADTMLADCLEARERGSDWRPKLVFSSNGQGIALAASDKSFAKTMQEADIIHADGMSVVFASKLTSAPLPERVATTDFFEVAAHTAVQHGLSFFILGSTKDENAAAAESIARLYPGLRLAGHHHGYFGPDEDEAVCQMVRESGADVLWVGLGKPLQEQWSVRNRDRLRGVGWIKTCGGLYAFLSGDAPRAPQLMQNLGLEWLHRMLADPRLIWRYITTNPTALYRLLRYTEWSGALGSAFSRVLVAAGAPALFAAANFILSLALQQSGTAQAFGLYAFAQVIVASGVGLSGGLFGGPSLVVIAKKEATEAAVLGSFFRANIVYCLICAGLLYAAALLAGASEAEASLMAALGATMWLRTFLRAQDLALQNRRPAALSDMTHALLVLAGLPVLVFGFGVTVMTAVALQLLGAALSVVPLMGVCRRAAEAALRHPMEVFFRAFARHGQWAVTAGIATQITSNAHAYVLTLAFGATVFAPIALATLLFRPLGVVLVGLAQFERPGMARRIEAGSAAGLAADVRFVRTIAAGTWVANVLTILALVVGLPSLLFREGYDAGAVLQALALMGLIWLSRAMREPKTAALQAAGEFKDLAKITLLCAPVTALGIAAALLILPTLPAFVLVGALVGEVLNLTLVVRRFARLAVNPLVAK